MQDVARQNRIERALSFAVAGLMLVACYRADGDDDDDDGGGFSGAGGVAGSSSAGNAGSAGLGAAGATSGAGGNAGSSGAATAGTSGASAGSSSGAAGASGSGGGDGRGSGQVTVLTMVNYPSAGASVTTFGATFERAGSTASSACAVTEYGACTLYECDPGATRDPVDAGTITATSEDAGFAQAIVPLERLYSTYTQPNSVFLGGESIAISAAGGVVPAFDATLPYPLLLLLTAPVLADGSNTLSASRGQDLTLSWDRGAPDVLFQVQSSSSVESASLICSELSEAGSMVLPAAALSALPSGTPCSLFTIGRAAVTAGDYDVFVVAAGAVMSPDRTRRIELILE